MEISSEREQTPSLKTSKSESDKSNPHECSGYFVKSAVANFEEGVSLLRESKFEMARNKFRASLNARILFYKDIYHVALAPVQEILGHVELKLGNVAEAEMRFNTAKEIVCERHLELQDKERENDDARVRLIAIIGRIKKGLQSVEDERNSEAKGSVEMDLNIVNIIVDDLSRYDELNMSENGRQSKEPESIVEEGRLINPHATKKPRLLKNTFSEKRLQLMYITKSKAAERQYSLKQYERAISSCNEARSALESLISSASYLNQDTVSSAYLKQRDEMNKTLLLERISDCHAETFSHTHSEENVDYEVVARKFMEIKANLESDFKRYRDEDAGPGKKANDVESVDSDTEDVYDADDLDELRKATVESMARVYSKQGLWCAKLNKHEMALDFYSKSLSVSCDLTVSTKGRPSVNTHLGMLTAYPANLTMIETQSLLTSFDESEVQGSALVYDDAVQMLTICNDSFDLWVGLYMACSHHFLGTQAISSQPKVAVCHYFRAYRLVEAAQRKHSKLNDKSLANMKSTRIRSLAAMTSFPGFEKSAHSFMQGSDAFKMAEYVHIAHALYVLGYSALSSKWLSKALADGGFASGANLEAEIVRYSLSVLADTCTHQPGLVECVVVDPLALYEGGLPILTSYDNKSRVCVYRALEEVHKRLHNDAITTADKALKHLKGAQEPLERSQLDEYLWIIDSQIAIFIRGGRMKEVLDKLNLRMELVMRWRSDEPLKIAKELMRLACFYTIIADHTECKELLEQALSFIKNDEGRHQEQELDTIKLLATTFDSMGHIDKAAYFYYMALDLEREKESAEKSSASCALLNAISHCNLLFGDCETAIGNVEESLQKQKDMAEVGPLHAETLILYGNIMAATLNLSQAAFYYDSAISSNPNKSPLEPTNLRAWYNKGVTQFRCGDILGAGRAFRVILDAIGEDANFVSPDVSYVLNAIGGIHFCNKMYEKAIEFYVESLGKSSRYDVQVGSLCNIAITYYMMRDYENAEVYFERALKASDSAEEEFNDTKAEVMSKLAYVHYKQAMYDRAYKLFSEASSLGASNPEFVSECESSAEMCRIRLQMQNDDADVPIKKREDITAKKPTSQRGLVAGDPSISRLGDFGTSHRRLATTERDAINTRDLGSYRPRLTPLAENKSSNRSLGSSRFVPVVIGQNTTKYKDFVYTLNDKILTMLGIEPSERGAFPSTPTPQKDLCDKMLGYLLKQTAVPRAQHALEFRQQLVDELDSKFGQLKKLLDKECLLLQSLQGYLE